MLTTAAMMPALLRPRGRSTGTRTPLSSRSCSTRVPSGPASTDGQLVGVDEAPPAGPEDLGRVVVQGAEQLGRRLLDRQTRLPAPGWTPNRTVTVSRHRRDRHPALGEDLLDPGAVGERPDLVAEGREAALVDLDHGPDVHPHVVHVELRARGAASHPGPTDRLQAALHRALRVRKGRDSSVLVADHGELAHLCQCHQPPVRRVLPRDALVEQDVLGRLDPGHVEVAETPQVQAPPDHRVDAAGEVVLGHAGRLRPVGRRSSRPAGCRRRRPRPRRDGRRGRTAAPRPGAGAARSRRPPTRARRASAGTGRPLPPDHPAVPRT